RASYMPKKTTKPKAEPIGAFGAISDTPCPRTYPLGPDTAEDPCEDCGRDQRKHELADPERQRIIDATAIALYAGGWPAKNCYPKAALLWELRREWLEKQR